MLFTAEDVFHIATSKGYGYLYQDLEDKGPCRQVGEAPWPSLYVCLAEASGAMQQARKAASPANQRKQVFFFCSLVAASLVAASLVKKRKQVHTNTQTRTHIHIHTYLRISCQEKGTSENKVPGHEGASTQTPTNTRQAIPVRARRRRMSKTHPRTYKAPKS